MTTGMDLASTGWPVEPALEPNNLEIVRALWLAHRESRVDDLLAMLRPDVHWYPLSRPGRSMYEGHDGVRRMLESAARTNGLYWVELDEVTEANANVVRAAARVVRPRPQGPATQLPIRLAITVRAGLVARVEIYPAR